MASPMSSVPFEQVPSNILVPFFWGEFNSGGSPYESFPRPLLLGQMVTTTGGLSLAGNATPGQVYGPIASHDDAVARFGNCSMLVAMYDKAAQAAPLQPFWALPIADPTGAAAAGSIVFTAPGITGQAILYIMGRQVTFQVNAADIASTVATNAAAAINALNAANALPGSNCPIVATASSGTVTLTCAHLGLLGNGLETIVAADQPNVLNGTNAVVTALTGGSGTPTLSTPLAALGSVPYDWIAAPYTDSTSLAAVAAFLNDQSGRWSPAQQLFGHYTTAYLGQSLSTLTTFGNTQNSQHVTVFGGFGSGVSPSPPWEVAASLVGTEALHLANPPELSRPLQTLALPGIVAPRSQASWWTVASRQALYSDGVAAGKVGVDGTCRIDRMVTTYQSTALGTPDQTFLDIETMAQGMYTMRYFRTGVSDEWGRAAFADEDPYNNPSVATPSKIKVTLINLYTDLCALGVAQHPELFQQYVVTARNALDPDRCDAYIPENMVGQLRVFAANVTAFRSYTSPGGAPLVPSAPGYSSAA